MYVLHSRTEASSLPRSELVRPWSLRESAVWRARWALLAVAAAAMLGLGYAHAADPAWSGASGGGRYQTVTVAQGDTLWTIATRRYPDADPRQKVGEIERANGLAGPVIEPGQRLKLPAD
jgi:nucleoid-associated protein YgaU